MKLRLVLLAVLSGALGTAASAQSQIERHAACVERLNSAYGLLSVTRTLSPGRNVGILTNEDMPLETRQASASGYRDLVAATENYISAIADACEAIRNDQ